jgi:hypothetical protein
LGYPSVLEALEALDGYMKAAETPQPTPEPLLTFHDRAMLAALTGLLAANATYGGRTNAHDMLAADARATADALVAAREGGK